MPVSIDDSEYLHDLANRLMHVPAEFGVDQGDVARLEEIASHVSAEESTS